MSESRSVRDQQAENVRSSQADPVVFSQLPTAPISGNADRSFQTPRVGRRRSSPGRPIQGSTCGASTSCQMSLRPPPVLKPTGLGMCRGGTRCRVTILQFQCLFPGAIGRDSVGSDTLPERLRTGVRVLEADSRHPWEELQELPRGLQTHPVAAQAAHDEEGVHRSSSRFQRPGQREAGKCVAIPHQPRPPAGLGPEQVQSVKGIGAVGSRGVAAKLRQVVAFGLREPFDDGPVFCGSQAHSDRWLGISTS